MDVRPIEQWATILAQTPAPDGDATAAARRIIGDLLGYNFPNGNAQTRARRQRDLDHDVVELANAIQAYARLIQNAGVKV